MNTDRIYYSHNAELHAMRTRLWLVLLFLTLGLGIGTIAALLFAPNSGKRTRKELSNVIEDGLKSGREAIEPIVNRIEKEVADLR